MADDRWPSGELQASPRRQSGHGLLAASEPARCGRGVHGTTGPQSSARVPPTAAASCRSIVNSHVNSSRHGSRPRKPPRFQLRWLDRRWWSLAPSSVYLLTLTGRAKRRNERHARTAAPKARCFNKREQQRIFQAEGDTVIIPFRFSDHSQILFRIPPRGRPVHKSEVENSREDEKMVLRQFEENWMGDDYA